MATNYTLWIWRCVIRLFLLFIVCVVRYQNRCFCCADVGENGRKPEIHYKTHAVREKNREKQPVHSEIHYKLHAVRDFCSEI